MKKVAKVLLLIAGLITAFLLYVQFTYQQTFEVPATGLKASPDSSMIARGKYLTMGPAHCWTCHVENPSNVDLKLGDPAMSGGMKLDLPFIATLYTPNITSDTKTEIVRYTDEQLARTLKYNVTPKGHALIPFMSYNTMSDEDVVAIISYLRSTEPVENPVPAHEIGMLGKLMLRFLLKPIIPADSQKFAVTQPDTTALYGKYLAYSVTNCNGCHTERGPNGEFTGKPFAGGTQKVLESGTFTVPNLTPDPETGRIYQWNQQAFIHRFRAGNLTQDGHYEFYFASEANDYGCKTDAFTFHKGTVEFNPGNSFTIHPQDGNFRGFYGCSPGSNFDRKPTRDELKDQMFYYAFETDDYGKEYLVVRFNPDDAQGSYFSPTEW